MSKTNRLYPYGFIFTEETCDNLPNHYIQAQILDKYTYYYDEIMEPHIYFNDDDFIIIHGHFVHIGVETQLNTSDLLNFLLQKYNNNYSDFLETLDFIGGRYIIIIGNKENVYVYPDATGARSAYYTLDRNIISSHVYMITDNFYYKTDSFGDKVPKLTFTFDRSPYEKIKSILPNFSLNLITKELNRFFPRVDNKYIGMNEQKKFELVEHFWKGQLKYYNEKYNNLILSLTGGNDSRFSLAMAKDYIDGIKFFTYSDNEETVEEIDKNANSLSIDQFIVKQILSDIPLNHKFFFYNENKVQLSPDEHATLSKNTIKPHGRFLIGLYNEAFPQKKVMHIRANLLEIGRAYFNPGLRSNSISEVEFTFKHGVRKYENILGKDSTRTIFKEGINTLQYDDNLFNYHILDMYYWEDRMGRWYSEVLNETDAAFDTLLPFNMRSIIDISLSFSVKERKSGYMFKELINRNFPILNFYGVNTNMNIYEQQKTLTSESSASTSKKSYFNSFIVYDNEANTTSSKSASENKIFIPMEYLTKGSYAEVNFTFKYTEGIVSLSLTSKYSSKKGSNYLQYELLKNGEIILKEDVAKWQLNNNINVLNMVKEDVLTIRVKSLKGSKSRSWESASVVSLDYLKEIKTDKKSPKEVTFTSPFSLTK